ncbi:hypothetical protein ACVWWR_000758 [Bradyrhizobium sp. LM3.2]
MFEAHFQTFEEPEAGVALAARLAMLREELARRKLTGFVIPRADQQQNEYVPPSEERLAWLTGFTGSAGLAVALTHEAALFVDGRYTIQAAKQVDARAWAVESLIDPPPESWVSTHLRAGDRLGFDPWLHTFLRQPSVCPPPAPRPAPSWSPSTAIRSMRSGRTGRSRRLRRSRCTGCNMPASLKPRS